MEREYIGIDLHKAFFQVCAVSATGERQWEQRWPTTDARDCGAVDALRPQSRSRSKRRVRPGRSSTGSWTTSGAVHVVDTRKTRIKAGYAAKTDRLDAQPPRRRVAARQRRRDLLPAAGDSRSARVGPVSLSSRPPAGEPETADSRVAVAAGGGGARKRCSPRAARRGWTRLALPGLGGRRVARPAADRRRRPHADSSR